MGTLPFISMDLRSIGWFRIALGFIILADQGTRLADWNSFHGRGRISVEDILGTRAWGMGVVDLLDDWAFGMAVYIGGSKGSGDRVPDSGNPVPH